MEHSISCSQCKRILSLMLPEDLSGLSDVNQNLFTEHLASCAKCALALKKNLETDTLLQSLPMIEPLSELPCELQQLWRTRDGDLIAEDILSFPKLNEEPTRTTRSRMRRLASTLALVAILLASLFASLGTGIGSSAQQASKMPSYLKTTRPFLQSYGILGNNQQGFLSSVPVSTAPRLSSNDSSFDINNACSSYEKYYRLLTEEEISTCFTSKATFSDFAYEVEMKIYQGDSGGIVFRANQGTDTYGYYAFVISSNGSYQLSIENKILNQGRSSAIKVGLNQTNKIAAVAQGDQVSLYANDQLLYQGRDSTFLQGAVGFISVSNSSLTDISFDAAKIWW